MQSKIIQGYPIPPKAHFVVYVNTCTFNHSAYIVDCLKGVAMQQTDFPVVHHVIDDCSTDGEQEVIKGYMERECDMAGAEYYDNNVCTIIVARHKSNPNCTLAAYLLKENLWKRQPEKDALFMPWLNVCKYEAICEGDDYWTDPGKLQKQVDYMEAHPHVSMMFHRAEIVNELKDKTVDLKSASIEDREYSSMELFKDWIVPTASMLVRRDAAKYFMTLKGRDRMVNGDICLVLSAGELGSIMASSETMSVYRMQSQGVTYDAARLKRVQMLWPEHFMLILENFPKLDAGYVKEVIARQLWLRYEIRPTFKGKWKDLRLCRHYAPKLFWLWVWRITIKNSIKKLIGC